jgi:hypothetical protein
MKIVTARQGSNNPRVIYAITSDGSVWRKNRINSLDENGHEMCLKIIGGSIRPHLWTQAPKGMKKQAKRKPSKAVMAKKHAEALEINAK